MIFLTEVFVKLLKIVLIFSLLSFNLYAKEGELPDKNTPAYKINRAKAFFDYGKYEKSIEILEELLNNRKNLNPYSLLNIYQLISRAEYYKGDLKNAEFYLKLLYMFKSDYTFDPVFINPEFIDFANKVYKKYEKEIIRNKMFLAKLLKQRNPDIYGDISKNKKFYKNFLPFGIGQFQNGHRYKGYMLAGLEVFFVVTSVVTYGFLKYYQRDDYTFENKDLAYKTKLINNISFYMFGGIYLYATIDAIVYYKASEIKVIQAKGFNIFPYFSKDEKFVVFSWNF